MNFFQMRDSSEQAGLKETTPHMPMCFWCSFEPNATVGKHVFQAVASSPTVRQSFARLYVSNLCLLKVSNIMLSICTGSLTRLVSPNVRLLIPGKRSLIWRQLCCIL
jgi:hypothetical protein